MGGWNRRDTKIPWIILLGEMMHVMPMPANLHRGLGRGEIGVDMKTTADLKSSIEDWEQIPGEFSLGR